MQNLASADPSSYTRAAFEQQIVTTIAAMNLLFSAVENLQFCQMLCMLRLDLQIPGRKHVKVLLKKRYSQIVTESFQDLEATIRFLLHLTAGQALVI